MTHRFYRSWPLLLLPLVLFVAGCGSLNGDSSNYSGVGPDAGPWPSGPNRSGSTPAANDAPPAPLAVIVRAKSAAKDEVRLSVAGIDLKNTGVWFEVAKTQTIAATTPQPARIGDKGAAVLLMKGIVAKRKYSHLRLRLDDAKTVLVRGDQTLPLTLQNNALELPEWTPDEKKQNVLAITIDGTKVNVSKDSATLPASAISAQVENAAGAVTGKFLTALPNARVELFWQGTKVSFGSKIPSLQDGTFAIDGLPAGTYTVEMTTPGYKVVEPQRDPVTVESKPVTLKDIALTPDTGTP